MLRRSKFTISLTLVSVFIVGMCLSGTSNVSNIDMNDGNNDLQINDPSIPELAAESPLSWWNESFRFRRKITVENTLSFARDVPVDLYLEFGSEKCNDNGTRIVDYDEGSDEWTPIPCQAWNKTWNGDYLDSCTVSFVLENLQQGEKEIYLYYDPDVNVTQKYSGYTFDAENIGDNINVEWNVDGISYNLSMEKDKGVYQLEGKYDENRHNTNSSSPGLSRVDTGLVGYWDFEETTPSERILDTYSEYQGSGSPTIGDGKFGNAYYFSGVVDQTQYIAVDANQTVYGGSNSENGFSVMTWVNPEDASNERIIASWDRSEYWRLSLMPDNTILWATTTTGSAHDMYTTQTVPSGSWTHIAATFEPGVDPDDGVKKIYINGTLVSTENCNYGLFGVGKPDRWGFIGAGSEATAFNGATNEQYGNYRYAGWMDEFRIYNKTVGNDEVKLIMQKSAGTSAIEDVTQEVTNGPVMAKYDLNWYTVDVDESTTMSITDTWTFYKGLNAWKVDRTFHWDNLVDESNNAFAAYNTLFNWTVTDPSQTYEDYYYYDNNAWKGHDNVDFTVENYTVLHDYDASDHMDAVGLFITDKSKGNVYMNFTEMLWRIDVEQEGQVNFVPGNQTDISNNGGTAQDYTASVEFWEYYANDVNQYGFGADNSYGSYKQYFDNYYNSLKTPLTISLDDEEPLFFSVETTIEDVDGLVVPNLNVTLYNVSYNGGTTYELVNSSLTDSEGVSIFNSLPSNNYTLNFTYKPFETYEALYLGSYDFELNFTETTYQNVLEIPVTVNLTSAVINFKTDPRTSDEEKNLYQAAIGFFEDTGVNNVSLGVLETNVDGNITLRWKNFTDGLDKIVFNCTVNGEVQLINMTADMDRYNLTIPFSNRSYYEVNVQTGDFGTNMTVWDKTTDKKFGVPVQYEVNYSYGVFSGGIPVDSGGIPQATVSYEIKYRGSTVWTGSFGKTNGQGNVSYTIDYLTDGIPLSAGRDYSLIISAEKLGYISQTQIFGLTLRNISTTLESEDPSESAYWGNNLEVNFFYNNTEDEIGITGATVSYQILGQTISDELPANGSRVSGWYSANIDTTLFPGTGAYTMKIVASQDNYIQQEIDDLEIQILDITTNLDSEDDSLTVYWFENFSIHVQFNDTLNEQFITTSTIQWSVASNPTINGLMDYNPLKGDGGWYSAEINSTELRNAADWTLKIDSTLANYADKTTFISVSVLEIFTALNGTDYPVYQEDVFALEPLTLYFNYSYRSLAGSSSYQEVPDATHKDWGLYDMDTNTLLKSGELIWDPVERLYSFDTNSENLPLGTYKFIATFQEINYEPQGAVYLMDIVNRTTKLDKETDTIEIYKTQEILFNYTYSDLIPEVDALITDAPIKTYEWTRYETSAKSTILDSGSGTLTLNANQNYTLDLDTETLGVGYYVIDIVLDKVNYTRQATQLILIISLKDMGISWSDNLDIDYPQLSEPKGTNIRLTITLADPQDEGNPLTGANVELILQNVGDVEDFDEVSPGVYVLDFDTEKYEAFTQDNVLTGKIEISKENYETTSKDIRITVAMQEIFDGVPLFYFIIVAGALTIIIVSMISYRAIQLARIPEFVKKCNATTKAIEKGKSIDPDVPITTPKSDYLISQLGEDWQYFGLNFADSLPGSLAKGEKEKSESYREPEEEEL
mgnify:CR=1 FL=1